jgi:hypothetical protein
LLVVAEEVVAGRNEEVAHVDARVHARTLPDCGRPAIAST